MPFYAPLPHRALVAVRGPDRESFLQALVSNDVGRVSGGAAVWAALLTPQGKFLHEFFMFACTDETGEDTIWLECEALRRDDLVARLARYRLRAKVSVLADDSLAVGVTWAESLPDTSLGTLTAVDGGVIYTDPRLVEAGRRWALPPRHIERVWADVPRGLAQDYDAFRMSLGLPDGSRDMEVEKALLLENGFEELHGVDYEKGCYIGQELTARTHYRALIKKRLLPVAVNGIAPPPGTTLVADGVEAGEMRSAIGDWGLALIRLEALRKTSSGILTAAGGARLRPTAPPWMKLPEPEHKP
ncbi:MAG: folate-binding protein [Rhodospirillaceae bacterium]|nr:MAG: folate-binding protein [Rhodospirillaceae bacterium]